MPPVGFEPTFSSGKRPQTYALFRAATNSTDLKGLIFIQNLHTHTNAAHVISRFSATFTPIS